MKIALRTLVCGLVFSVVATAQVTSVDLPQRTANYNATWSSNGGTFDESTDQVGTYANGGGGDKQVVAWRNFTTNGLPSGGSNRTLQVGDEFSIKLAATRANGQLGISLNNNASTGNWANRNSNSRTFINLDGPAYTGSFWGEWYVNHNDGTSLSGISGSVSYIDYTITVKVLSSNSFTVKLNDVYARDLKFTGSGLPTGYSIYHDDDWNGSSNSNAYWKPDTYVRNTGTVEFGYGLTGTSTLTVDGVISDGLLANSTSTVSPNKVFVGGAAGTRVNFTAANTHSGQTIINTWATLRIDAANRLGTSAEGTIVNNGGALELNGGFIVAAELLTLNGEGISSGGALRNISGNNSWNGSVTIGSKTRVFTEPSTTLTLSGVVSGSGQLIKTGGGTLVLSGNNTHTKETTISGGTLRISHDNALGATADSGRTRVNSGYSLELTGAITVPEHVIINGNGVSSAGALRNISGDNTLSGQLTLDSDARVFVENATTLTNSGFVYSGAARTLTKTGNGTLTLSGTGSNTFSSGTIAHTAGTLNLSKSGSAKAVDNVTVSDGATLNTNAANQWGTGTPGLLTNSGTFNLNNHNQKVALAGSGTINLGSATLTIENTLTDTYSGSISSTGGLIKTGAGDQTLSGALTYTGSTTISQGILDMQTNTIGSLTVESGGTLRLSSGKTLTVDSLNTTGDSRINANANSTLVISSGASSIGTETIHHLKLKPGATLTVREGKTLTINGTLELNGGTLVLQAGAIPAVLAYGASAELFYNGATTLSPGNEWTAAISPNTVRVGNGSTVNLSSSTLAATSLIINTGGAFGLGSHSLELRSGGNLTNNGTFNAGTGTIVFKGSNTVGGSSSTTLHNVDIDGGGVNFGTSCTVNNTLRILTGGFVDTNRPTYGSNATLVYETGGNFDINSESREWQLGTTENNPPNVEIRTSSVVMTTSTNSGLRAGNLTLNSSGSMTLNPPTTSVTSFNLLYLSGNLSLNGTGSLTVNNGDGNNEKPAANGAYDVRVMGNITIGSEATLDLNANIGDDLYVRGNFTIDGDFLPSGRVVYFTSTTAKQILTDNGDNVFNFVRVSNTSGLNPALEVTTDWTVANQLDVFRGIVTTTTGNTLYLLETATLTFDSLNNWYLNGRTQQTKTLSGSEPVAIAYGLTINPDGNNLGSTTVVTTSGPDGIVNPEGPGEAAGIAKRWDITPTTQPSTDVDLEFFWSTAHQNGKATDNLVCWRLPNEDTVWRMLDGVYNLTDGNPVQPVPGFSGFTFSDGSNPLPVEMVTFEGQPTNGQVLLTWTTATEVNSAFFTVERSRDAIAFQPIGKVAAAGISTRVQEYSLLDQKPFTGLNYYRLRQTDLDGTEAFSKIIAVRFAQAGPDAVFPMPVQDVALVTWTLDQDGPVWFSLTDMAGRVVLTQQETAQSGSNRFALDLSSLPAGFYVMELRDELGMRFGTAPIIRQ